MGSLVAVSTVDTDCANGGVRINVGLDNGDGGGVAGDDSLQSGEIDDSAVVCHGADSQPSTAPESGAQNCAGAPTATAVLCCAWLLRRRRRA